MCGWHWGQLESADFSSQNVFSLLAKTREFQKTYSAKFIKAALLECLVRQTKPFLKLFLVIFNFSFISLVSLKEARVPSRTIRAICNEPPQWNKRSERCLDFWSQGLAGIVPATLQQGLTIPAPCFRIGWIMCLSPSLGKMGLYFGVWFIPMRMFQCWLKMKMLSWVGLLGAAYCCHPGISEYLSVRSYLKPLWDCTLQGTCSSVLILFPTLLSWKNV